MVTMHPARQFSFQGQSLLKDLLSNIQPGMNGYWQHQFDQLSATTTAYWYLGIANGKIVHSDTTPMSSVAILRLMQRFMPQIRQELGKESFSQLKEKVLNQSFTLAQLLEIILHSGVASKDQLNAALRLKVLNDLDTYLQLDSGNATFIPEVIMPLQNEAWFGGEAQSLIQEALQRQVSWQQVKQLVPSIHLVPKLNTDKLIQAALPPAEKAQIQRLGQTGKTINQIAVGLAKDSFEVSMMFTRLVRSGLMSLETEPDADSASVMIIDDSPLVLKQFQHWVSELGYQVVICQEAETALTTIAQTKPATIFIDINMPGISGFELVKQIRQNPQIASIPLVILTGEQKLSNKWRAQWSGCEFLTKPLSTAKVSDFQAQLQKLLKRLVVLPVSA